MPAAATVGAVGLPGDPGLLDGEWFGDDAEPIE